MLLKKSKFKAKHSEINAVIHKNLICVIKFIFGILVHAFVKMENI